MSYHHYYFYNYTDENGRHEVHTKDCTYLPNTANKTYIGYESSCQSALATAARDYPGKRFDGCFFCSRPCHRG